MNKEMTAKQNAKLNMYRATEKHTDDNAAIIAENVAFQTAFNKLKTNIVAITDTARQKSAPLTGVAADKARARKILCETAAKIAGAISAYASATGSETLKHEMNLPVSTLQRSRDEALVPRCQMILDRARSNAAALDNYGIKPAQLTELQTATDNYAAQTTNPRQAVSQRKTVNANLDALFKETDHILKDQMDKLIELYRADHPDFVNTYFETRIIVDPPTRARKTEDAANKTDHETSG